jgi:hypothetical protein
VRVGEINLASSSFFTNMEGTGGAEVTSWQSLGDPSSPTNHTQKVVYYDI